MLLKSANFFDDFKHCLTFFLFRKQYCASAQLRGTIVPKNAAQQGQVLMLFGTVELFCIPAAMLYFGAFDG